MIRYAKLQLAFDFEATKKELLSLQDDDWKPHFNTYHYEGAWTALALRSPGGGSDNIIPDLIKDAVYADTVFMGHFLSVAAFLSQVQCPVMSVRFLNLQAGAAIKQHTDKGLAFERGEARLHMPILTNPGVEFYVEDDRIPFSEGDCWYINANLPHRVANNGATDRIHLVLDFKVNDWLTGVIEQSPVISRREEKNNDLPKIIDELRRQNTAGSNKLADELQLQLNGTDL